MRAALIAIAALLSVAAEAQTVRVEVVHRYHSRGLSRKEARAVFADAYFQPG
jgi:hypothetical protein